MKMTYHQFRMIVGSYTRGRSVWPSRIICFGEFNNTPCPRIFERGYHASRPKQLQHDLLRTASKFENIDESPKNKFETLKIQDIDAPHRGVIKVVSLNRPKARNALSKQLLKELGEQIEDIHAEGSEGPTRVLVLASEVDSCFCAGADLKERKGMGLDETAAFLATIRHTFKRLAELPIPTIAAVSSVALGGGLELALCTDVRVFSSNAAVGQPEVRLAIIPGAGGTYRLPAVVGQSRAKDLILTGRRINGRTAFDWGLCNYLVDMHDDGSPKTDEHQAKLLASAREMVLEQSVKTAKMMSEGGPLAIRAAVQALKGVTEEAENAAYDSILHTRDRLEALQAFSAKPSRKPEFKGR